METVPLFLIALVSFATAAPGNEFVEDDVLIGVDTLFDSGEVYTMPDTGTAYRTTLLVQEGNTDKFGESQLRSGYYMGFQWYNSATQQDSSEINIQLFTGNTVNISADTGEFTLIKETGWIKPNNGLNTFYFDDTIPIDNYGGSGSMNYIIGIVSTVTFQTPILHQEGCSNNNVVWYSDSDTLISVGNRSSFEAGRQNETGRCLSFSIQGLFLPAGDASTTQGSCQLIIVNTEKYKLIVSHQPFPGDGYRNERYCYILRADLPERGVRMTVNLFDIYPKTEGDCDDDLLIIDDYHRETDDYVNQWGIYCGSDIFDSRSTKNPYVSFAFSPSISNEDGYYKGFLLSVDAVENKDNTLAIVLGVLGSVAVVVAIAGVAWYVIQKNKRKKRRGQVF